MEILCAKFTLLLFCPMISNHLKTLLQTRPPPPPPPPLCAHTYIQGLMYDVVTKLYTVADIITVDQGKSSVRMPLVLECVPFIKRICHIRITKVTLCTKRFSIHFRLLRVFKCNLLHCKSWPVFVALPHLMKRANLHYGVNGREGGLDLKPQKFEHIFELS